MKTIWKFPFVVQDYFHLTIPRFSRIVLVECQGSQACMWCEVDSIQPPTEYFFRVFGTGHQLPEEKIRSGRLTHQASFQQPPFVWHLYQEFEP